MYFQYEEDYLHPHCFILKDECVLHCMTIRKNRVTSPGKKYQTSGNDVLLYQDTPRTYLGEGYNITKRLFQH